MNLDGTFKQRQREAELDRCAHARKQWQESEWVVDCLRSKTGSPLKEFSDEQIVDWHQKVEQR